MMVSVLAGTICLSAVWVVAAWHFITMSLNGMSFFDAGILNAILYILFVCLPLFLMWCVFGFISQTMYNHKTAKQMQKLFAQMKKNQEYSDLLARIMLTSEQDSKSSFELSRFDLLLADINELLSEFISRQRMASEEQIEYLWSKVQNGGKWSFGKVIIENFNRQPNFKQKVLVNVLADNVLAGTVLEFCARYQTIVKLLEKYDKEKIFLDIIETGVMGKVFAIMAPISNEINRSRESIATVSQPVRNVVMPQTQNMVEDEDKDKFSLALKRSFGSESPFSESEVSEEKNMPVFLSEESEVSETQKTLNSLKKEWQDMGNSAVQKDKTDDLTYPFGGWTDAQNYKK